MRNDKLGACRTGDTGRAYAACIFPRYSTLVFKESLAVVALAVMSFVMVYGALLAIGQ